MAKNKRNLDIELIPTTEQNRFLQVSVSYHEGGANYFNGGTEQRGYYLHVSPEIHEGGFVKFQIGGGPGERGYKAFLELAERFNAKRLHALSLMHKSSDQRQTLIDNVLKGAKYKLLEPATA